MFDFVVNNNKPIVFPDVNSPQNDGFIYDPANGTAYAGEYQYRWANGRWVSHLDIFSLKITDQKFLLVFGDKMTGGLMMGDDILEPELELYSVSPTKYRPVRRFIARKYNLYANNKLPADQIRLFKPHVLEGTQAINNRLKITKHAEVFDFNKEPVRTIQWHRLDFPYSEITVDGETYPVTPSESDWDNDGELVETNKTQYVLTNEDLNMYIRSVETYTDPGNGTKVKSIVDTQRIRFKG